MAARHEEWVITLLGQLSEQDVSRLMALLAKVKTTISRDAQF
jgi:hypothetical protein